MHPNVQGNLSGTNPARFEAAGVGESVTEISGADGGKADGNGGNIFVLVVAILVVVSQMIAINHPITMMRCLKFQMIWMMKYHSKKNAKN